jgi:hypothetical protein
MFQATLMASNRLTGARDAASIDRGLPVVHSGPDQRAEPCAVLDDVQQDPHRRRQGDHEQPVRRVGEAAQPHTLREDGGDRDRARVATEDRETPVGDHQRDADGEQDLGQLLAAHPTEEDALGRQPEHGRRGHTGEDRHQEVARSREGGDADIAADEIEGPVRKVNDLHQAEQEGESAREQEEQCAETQSVQRLQQQLVNRHCPERPGVAPPGLGSGGLHSLFRLTLRRAGDVSRVTNPVDLRARRGPACPARSAASCATSGRPGGRLKDGAVGAQVGVGLGR